MASDQFAVTISIKQEGELAKGGNDLIDLDKAFEETNIPTSTLRRWIRQGKLHGDKFGGAWVVSRDDLAKIIEGGGYHPNMKRR